MAKVRMYEKKPETPFRKDNFFFDKLKKGFVFPLQMTLYFLIGKFKAMVLPKREIKNKVKI